MGGEKPQAGYMIFHGEDLISFHSGRDSELVYPALEHARGVRYRDQGSPNGTSSLRHHYFRTRRPTGLSGEAVHSKDELGLPMPVYCDNKSACLLSEGNTSSKRMRHVATKIAFLREQIKDDKRVHMCHIRTQGQLADIMTKPLVASVFHPLAAFALG